MQVRQIIPFEDLHVTTMTLVMTFTNGINKDFAFHLLPITRIDMPPTQGSGKCKLPHCSVPGSILSMRYDGKTRGIIINKSRSFKNAITIDISTTKKNVNLKLSPFSIQICGASCRDDGIEAANYILGYLRSIQERLRIIQAHETKFQEEMDWIFDQTKGENVEIPDWKTHKNNETVILKIYNSRPGNKIRPINIEPPEHLNKDIIKFFISYSDDFLYHGDFYAKIDSIRKLTEIINEPIELKTVDEAMVNYNYSLGFEIDRAKLNELIDSKHCFISRYNNALSTSVTIELPYEPLESSNIKRRKSKIPHHTFLCYRSGSVTQSGPGGQLMRDVYYLFMNTIREIMPYIKYEKSSYSPNLSVDT